MSFHFFGNINHFVKRRRDQAAESNNIYIVFYGFCQYFVRSSPEIQTILVAIFIHSLFANSFLYPFTLIFLLPSISSPFSSGIMSVLFNITIIFDISNSPITRHSAVYVYIPLLISMTRNIMSIILAPPIIVLISEACPGQSTSVNWKY